jgi:hypothetical protein
MSTSTSKPAYYDTVAARARKLCSLLEQEPDLSGAWNLLFEQIQNPAFVISELLQNADDAGATRAEVSLNEEEFIFTHNGQDFTEDQFASLCRFGFSNKRTIHTIGFRGIGFKSAFSLGRTVEVWSPSLGVAFSDERFIEPRWIHDCRPVIDTQIKIRIDRKGAYEHVRSSLEKWQQSPASLLFFNNIRKLTLNGQVIERTESRTRIPHTFAVELNGRTKQSLYLLRSEEEPFPPEAIAEIAQTRKIADLNLGGCRVEVVLGIPGDQHLFVVLPTGEPLTLPFSVNAPFLLKPDRFDIKPPSTSPTNAWLLERAGRLVAEVVLAWLGNETLSIGYRTDAYRFLPDPQALGSIGSVTIRDTLLRRLSPCAVVLNCYEKLCEKGAASVPAKLFDIWSGKQVRSLFSPEVQLLHPEVSPLTRQTLVKLGWVEHIAAETILERMTTTGVLPRPDSHTKLALLWEFIFENAPRFDEYYGHRTKRAVPIVPVVGKEGLHPATSVVRISTRSETLSADTISWLSERTSVLDLKWVDSISKFEEARRDTLTKLLGTLQLHEPTQPNRLVEQAAASVFARKEVTVDECVHLAQLFAALRANTPKGFHFVTGDNYRRTVDHGLVFDPTGEIADLAPESWAKEHILHSSYETYVRCTEADWQRWVSSPESGLRTAFPVKNTVVRLHYRSDLRKFLVGRNSAEPSTYHYKRDIFSIEDHSIDAELINHWNFLATSEPQVWQRVLRLILTAGSHEWKDALTATAYQRGNESAKPLNCPPITAEWLAFFRDKPCLADTDHQTGLPSELYRRTPDTDVLQGSREYRFVEAELDIDAVRPVLRHLGTLDTPADYQTIIKRLESLRVAPASDTVFAAVNTFYQILDRIVARCRPMDRAELESVFAQKPLVMAADRSWQTAGELSVFPGDDETPDPASHVHPAFQGMSMWARVGVSQHPSASQTLEWLQTLPTGHKLDGPAYTRVQRALARDPLRIWQECDHWISLDRTWEPVARFTHSYTMEGLGTTSQLAPGVKQRVADFRRVATAVRVASPFSALPELIDALETRVTRFVPSRDKASAPGWLATLADAFRRVKLSDSEKQNRVRSAAVRLARTHWLVARELEITPYLDQTPAGVAAPAKVAWAAEELYLLGSYSGRLHRSLVGELSHPFDSTEVARAFDSCIGRDEEFIADYLADHFTFEETEELPVQDTATSDPTPPASATTESADPTAVNGEPASPNATPDHTSDEPSPDGLSDSPPPDDSPAPAPAAKPRHVPEPTVFDRYAASLGFKAAGNGYAHPNDGRQIIRGEAPFQWHMIDARENCIRRFWTSRDHLENGVEVAAEVWSLTLHAPGMVTWVVASRDRDLVALTGHELDAQTQAARLRLYPSSYRLRPEGVE